MTTPKLLSVSEAVEVLRIAKSTLFKKVCRREIPHVKIGGRLLFDAAELITFIDKHRIPTA